MYISGTSHSQLVYIGVPETFAVYAGLIAFKNHVHALISCYVILECCVIDIFARDDQAHLHVSCYSTSYDTKDSCTNYAFEGNFMCIPVREI